MAKTALIEEEFSGKIDLRVWLKIFRTSPQNRKYIYLMAVLAVFTAIFDVSFTLITRALINDIDRRGTDVNVWVYGAGYLALVVGFCSCIFTFIWAGGKISTGVSHDIREAGFRRLQELSFSYYDHRSVGWLVTRLTSDCDRLARLLSWGVLDIVWGVFMLVLIAGIMIWVDWWLALVVLAVVPLLAWASLFFQRRILSTSRKVRKTNSSITAAYNEGISGVRTTKTLVREEENLDEFGDLTGDMYRSSVRAALLSAVYLPLVMTLGGVATAVALWQGGQRVLGGAMLLGDLYLFIAYAGQFFMPIQEMARVLADLQSAQAAAERVTGLLEAEPEIEDSPEVAAAVRANAGKQLPADVAFDGGEENIRTIEFDHVTFQYVEGEKVLDDFSLTVHAGQTIALVGPTGGGKSTIVSLVARFYEPTSGAVKINGVDYRKRSLHWLQSNLGIVLQQPHLFSGTVRENIRYGRLEATDSEVEWAAEVVNADGFVRELIDGYETEVGADGVKLSAGQKQLISLARAVLADPKVFVMDEATSSVDTETERLIQAGVDRILRDRISFVIAHRLSTIRHADRILFVEDGKIVEDGSHRDLLAAKGRYYELYTNQFTREHEEEALHT
ncbi:MAG: ABC transporter ATP-binding protein [Phycisphaerae bacterium]